ncbi:MAG TPA: phosphatidylglycerophosphatase A [Candidatus Sulfotelmatobacter sp.]|jgi:phosphatidylglycerophosphatase A|nr:phosphatidylglycerophosphatase A [Candidatus Sulfotelmatobacter sp.]
MSLPLSSLRNPAILLATWFGAGLMPKAPGTWGSLAALPFAWIIMHFGGSQALAAASLIVYVVGVWAADRAIGVTGIHDPGLVVIDEVVGQWIVLLFTPLDPLLYLVGFGLFRLFDIVKPWPVGWADRKVEGGTGVMLDDVLAGLYGLAVIEIVQIVMARLL